MTKLAEKLAKAALPAHALPLSGGNDPLNSLNGCANLIEELLETAPADFGRKDLAFLNLICAPALPGSEKLDIPKSLARLNWLTAFVRSTINRNRYRFAIDPRYGHCEPMWLMAHLVTAVKRDFGAAYSPNALDDLEAGIDAPFSDSREIFIQGLLDDDRYRRWGTCTSIPSLIASVARRLHYPVGLAVTRTHVYARWEGAGICFNIEASNPMGMVVHSDEHYRGLRGGISAEEEKSGFYLRTLFPAEEFALFLKCRVRCLLDAARYQETLVWAARALQYAPDDPYFPAVAHYALELAAKHRYWRLHPGHRIPPPDSPETFTLNFGELLAVEERSPALTIMAHYKESLNNLDEARALYEGACRQHFHGDNEQRDLQRFLRKHGLPRKNEPLLPPENLGFQRCFTLHCPAHEEAKLLRRMADSFERAGELLKARGALHDLYMFDPGDAGVFQRVRAVERHPRFRAQLDAAIEQKRGNSICGGAAQIDR